MINFLVLFALVVGVLIGAIVRMDIKITHYHTDQLPKDEQKDLKPTQSSANLGLIDDKDKQYALENKGKLL